MRSAANRKIRTEKIVMLGAASSGKTSIVNRFAHDRFSPNSESTIGAAFVSKVLRLQDREVKLEIWDTGGSEKYRSLAPMYYRDTQAAIIVFDITAQPSLEDAEIWLNELRERGPPRVVIACAANKCDLESQREVGEQKVKEFAANNGITFIRNTSALTGQNINELFTEVATHLLTVIDPDSWEGDEALTLTTNTSQIQKKGCC